MMNSRRRAFRVGLVLCAMLFAFSVPVWGGDEGERVKNAALVLQEFMNSPDKAVPMELFSNAAAVAIFPRVLKGAFIVGGQFGQGVMCARDSETGEWTAPAFFTLGGGSFGFQIGGEAIDFLLVIRNRRGLDSLLKGKVTLGGDVSAAAGPVGRTLTAETDVLLTAEILTYSRTKGFFAGVSLKGSAVAPDPDADKAYYGVAVDSRDILLDKKVKPSGEALELVNTLKAFSK